MTRLRPLWLISCILLCSPAWAQFTDAPTLEDCAGSEDPLATNWSGPIIAADTSQFRELGTACERQPVAGTGSSYWDVATFGPDVKVTATCVSGCSGAVTAGITFDLLLRVTNPNSTGATDGYLCKFFARNTTELARIYRVDNDVETQIASANVTVDDGAKVGCEAIGSTLKVWADTGGGWTELLSVTDATYTAAGYWGVRSNNAGFDLDNIGAATYTAAGTRPRTMPIIF